MSKKIPLSPTFSAFWDAYGYKRDKVAAERAWNRLSVRDKAAAFAGISAYKKDCMLCGRQMMYAQGYLNHRRWEDECTGPSAITPNVHGTTITASSVSLAERCKEEVQRLSLAATASAAALASLFSCPDGE